MNGFIRMLAADFPAFNLGLTEEVRQATGDDTLTEYTYSLPDSDPLYVWARIEEDGYQLLLQRNESYDIKSKEDAVLEGMVIPVAEGEV